MPTAEELMDAAMVELEGADTVADGIPIVIKALNDQIAELLAGQPALQAKASAIFDKAVALRQEIADALVANTPSEPGSEPTAEGGPGAPGGRMTPEQSRNRQATEAARRDAEGKRRQGQAPR